MLFEGTYGQPLVRKGATYEYDWAKCETDRGALVPWLERPLLSFRGRALVEAHWLRSLAQLLLPLRLLLVAAVVSGVNAGNDVAQASAPPPRLLLLLLAPPWKLPPAALARWLVAIYCMDCFRARRGPLAATL